MSQNKLTIIKEEAKRKNSESSLKREKIKSYLNQLWEENPAKFDPLKTALGRDRVKKTLQVLENYVFPEEKTVADLGFGTALFTLDLERQKALVDAVDLSDIPIEALKNKNLENIRIFQDYIPKTTLEGDFYDLVLALELIAYLNKDEYRLFFAELARLVKLDGFVMVSTPIDIYSEDALQNFGTLAETEFTILEWQFSYHKYFIRLISVLKAPAIFVKAAKDNSFYEKELNKRFSIQQFLFRVNCSRLGSFFWRFIKLFTNPLFYFIKQSDFILLKLEKLCRFISSDNGISHALLIGKKRKVFEEISKDEAPIERKGKRQIWE